MAIISPPNAMGNTTTTNEAEKIQAERVNAENPVIITYPTVYHTGEGSTVVQNKPNK